MYMGEKKNNLVFMQDITKIYNGKVVLEDIDLSIKSGELCTIVGPSGCGKSTLLRLILGQDQPTGGELLINGKPVSHPDPTRGIVYQKYSLFPHLNILNNVMIGKKLSVGFFDRIKSKEAFKEEAIHYLEKVKLKKSDFNKYPNELSGGMQQRVALAQTLIMRPKIILMDEPFGALDPGTREHAQVFLSELWEEFGMTIFFVTHDLEEAAFLGTRLLVLSQFYSDDRGEDYENRGAMIVADYPLNKAASSTDVKKTAEFGEFIQQVRKDGFERNHKQHVKKFNLVHPDSFSTLANIQSS